MHTHNNKIARIEKNSDWLPLGAVLGEHVRNWADSNDLVLYIGLDGAAELGADAATAFYDPRTREIEVSAPYAFGPEVEHWMIDVEQCKTKKGLLNHPVLGGLLLHESMHAKYSDWDNPDVMKALVEKYGRNVGQQVMKIYTLMEEIRIENQGVYDWKRDAGFLRASARKLSKPVDGSELNLVSALILILAREQIKVLTKRDVHKVYKKIVKMLDKPLGWDDPSSGVSKADGVQVYRDAMKHIVTFANIIHTARTEDELMSECKSVYDLLAPYMPTVSMPNDGFGEEGEGEGEGEEQIASPDGKGECEDGSPGKGDPGSADNGKLSDDLLEDLEDAFTSAELGGSEDVWQEAARDEAEKQAREAERRAEEDREHDQVSRNTFERSHGDGGKTKSRIVSQRPPTDDERRSMVSFNAALQESRHRERKVGIRQDFVPPGRLQSSAALRDEAVRWAGGVSGQTLMFKGKRRTHVDEPDLTVGIICDISGSMGGTMEAMASSTWIMANSVNRIEGSKCAAVYYGESVFPTLWPGEKLEQVTRYNANDSFEQFNAAFQAINGKLNLLRGDGVRLLVVTSDGNYRDHEERACRMWLSECQKAGVGVLWLGLKQGRAEKMIADMGSGGEFVDISGGVVESTGAISSAVVKALRGY